jgi:cytochrome c biogenesis protein CcmG/thiol:disulfide interchange protein DsbE
MSGKENAQAPRGPAFTWTVIGAVIVAVGLVAFFLLGSSTSGGNRSEGDRSAGVTAPQMRLVDFSGKPFTLAEYRGTPVVVNFWASWCPFCIAEMPGFEEVHQALGDKVQFVGIDQRDNFDAAKRLAAETGVTYRLVKDPDGRAYDAIANGAMPTTAFIDADGKVVEVVGGQLSEDQLRERILNLFGVSA